MKARIAIIAVAAALFLGLIVGTMARLSQPSLDSLKVGSLDLVMATSASATNDIDEATAINTALRTIAEQARSNGAVIVSGYVLTSGYHATGLVKATTSSGAVYTTFSRPRDVWVLEFSAPAQAGWAYVSAIAVIDAQTGEVMQLSEHKHN
jgi:hypothetical protein